METLLIWTGNQSKNGSLTDYSGATPLRAVIKRDAYDFQSHGTAQAWTSDGWTDIQRFPIDRFAIKDTSYVSKDGTWETVIESDLLSLIEYAHSHMNNVNKEDN